MAGEDEDEKGETTANLNNELEILRDYYKQYNIDLNQLDQYGEEEPRFIRLNPRFEKAATLRMIQDELVDVDQKRNYPKHVSWIDSTITRIKNRSRDEGSSSFTSWNFYSLPANFSVAQSKAYTAGRIYGQDISSGVAVSLLLMESHVGDTTTTTIPTTPRPPHRILDLCCAPGLKLCAILDWLEEQQKNQSTNEPKIGKTPFVVGVDLSESRLDVAKKVIQKYHIHPNTSGRRSTNSWVPAEDSSSLSSLPHVQLYHGDGTTFGTHGPTDEHPQRRPTLVFDSEVARDEQIHRGERKRSNKSSRARERKRFKQMALHHSSTTTGQSKEELHYDDLFDRVLVDAECSTDGSLKHVKKLLQQQRFEKPPSNNNNSSKNGGILSYVNDTEKMEQLVDLQKCLLSRAFALLRPGGLLVYSTCSLSQRQNEEVVRHLLGHNTDAILVNIPLEMFGYSKFVQPGSLEGTVRFLPNIGTEEHYGGGFFLARIGKADRAPVTK